MTPAQRTILVRTCLQLSWFCVAIAWAVVVLYVVAFISNAASESPIREGLKSADISTLKWLVLAPGAAGFLLHKAGEFLRAADQGDKERS